MTGSRYFHLILGVLMVLIGGILVFGAVYRLSEPKEQRQQQTVQLPANERKQEVANGYLYASNEDLRELLPRIDMFMKDQDLDADPESKMFEYPEESKSGERTALQQCVEFKYFERNNLKAAVTLIPPDSTCFTDDRPLADAVASLYADYRYVYAITTPERG